MASTEPNLVLYTTITPNGMKISIALEELGLPYKPIKIDMTKNEQKSDWFLRINPNGRIPALTDTRPPATVAEGKNEPIHLWESGSILLYLTTHYDPKHQLGFPVGTREWHDMVSWVFFQNAGLGPMQGQANHFVRYAPPPADQHAYGAARYQNETRRLYRVLDAHLAAGDKQFLVGDKLTVADITCWGWVSMAAWAGVDLAEFPSLQAWERRLGERPAFQRGGNVPDPNPLTEILKDPAKIEEFAAKGRKVVQEGMKKDAEK
ncbi:MAG: hypothetical protein M1821_004691 [Bathelium mastoideum]|nr:MAG: hypothetical protein M1821_004691 [Bathelium mastoideum]